MIEAQRMEAAEQRRADELHRRRTQQQSRKIEKKEAHKKHVARVLAKQALAGLKINTMRQLKD